MVMKSRKGDVSKKMINENLKEQGTRVIRSEWPNGDLRVIKGVQANCTNVLRRQKINQLEVSIWYGS